MTDRLWRRSRQQSQGILPVRRSPQLSHTLSCWYCDFKITVFNDLVSYLGRRHARFLKVWFSIGIGFSIMAITGSTLILLWELIFSHIWKYGLGNLSMNWLFGMSQFSRFSLSLMDLGVMVYSTFAAVVVHEFGHALAAASQGLQVEYVAMFLAIIFPGAFVAFNYDFLQNSTLSTALRIYCAGIWHNAVLCAVCWLTLLFLPALLHPLYIHSENPMVVDIASTTPLLSYLSQGDVVLTLNGKYIFHPQEWVDMLVQIDTEIFSKEFNKQNLSESDTFTNRKGYCVPTTHVEESRKHQGPNNSSCSDESTSFLTIPCFSSLSEDGEVSSSKTTEIHHCLMAEDIVKLKKCGNGWETTRRGRLCACHEGESCVAPIQLPGLAWFEISFSRPYSSECLGHGKNQSSLDSDHLTSESDLCRGVFVFVGDAISLVNSITLSAYKPRWSFGGVGIYLPIFLEKVLSWTLHVSASLALFNSLPAFFLDAESILEACILCLHFLRPRTRRRTLRLILCGGSVLFIFASIRILLSLLRRPL